MKQIYTILVLVLITARVFAQTPEKMSYQAVVRNSSDQLITNQAVGMQISILQGGVTGTAVYVETQTPITNANGLVSIEIGNGTVVNGDFTTIDWANNTYFIKTEIDLTGGINYTITGTSQLLSVAYALHAKTAESIEGVITETDPVYISWNKSYNDLTNKPNITDTVTAVLDTTTQFVRTELDDDPNNEIQTISRTGLTVTLSNGGGTFQDSINTYIAGTGINITNNIISAMGSGTSGHYVGELYGGGIVFYIYDNGQHGLIASLDDLDGGSGVAWSATGDVEIGASAKTFYDGTSNTTAIVAQDNTVGYAATLCDSYSNAGVSDWYLPSSWEINLLYNSAFVISKILESDGDVSTNGFNAEKISPTNGRYWSSTEFNSSYAWSYRFTDGTTGISNKSDTYRVRAVRGF